MTDPKRDLLESVLSETRDLIKRLEGSSVQRLSVEAGETKIEIERGAPAPAVGVGEGGAELSQLSGPVAGGPAGGLGTSVAGRAASGIFSFGDGPGESDNRIPVLAPLVGTFYGAATPGAKPFVEKGDVVEVSQTVCIVEAMKLMNEVAAGEAGKVVEICVEDGDPVEFEQVLLYLEPSDE